jgi:hypothetical protein
MEVKMQKSTVIFTIILLICSVGALLAGCQKQPEPAPTTPSTTTPTPEPAPKAAPPTRPLEIPDGWSLYYEKGMEISFYYPPEWGEVIDYSDYFLKLTSGKEREELSKEEKERMETFKSAIEDSGQYLAFSNLDMDWAAHIRRTSVEKMQSFVSDIFTSQEVAQEGSRLMLMPLFGFAGSMLFDQNPGLAEYLPQMVGDIAALSEGVSPEELRRTAQPVSSLFANGLRYMADRPNSVSGLKTTYGQIVTYDGQLSGITETGREGWDVAARDYWDCILIASDGQHLVYISFSLESDGQQTQFLKFAKTITLSPTPASLPKPSPAPTQPPSPPPATAVNFPDSNLEVAIREAIGKPEGVVDTTDLASLTSFEYNYGNISDLSGLENCVNLNYLRLSSNEIADLSAVSSLTNLTALILNGNQISTISPLSGLTSLSSLDLVYNQISDISPLSSLTDLTYLNLSANQISDASPLSGLTEISVLYLTDNQIKDISALSSLTNLNTLWLHQNQISDISPLLHISNLTDVHLRQNPLGADSVDTIIPQLRARGVSVDYDTEEETRKAELSRVQEAVIAMMLDNYLMMLPNPVTEPTNDMSQFPDAISLASGPEKMMDPDGNHYTASDKDGFVLFEHDIVADGAPAELASYLPFRHTKYFYLVIGDGTVIQVPPTPPELEEMREKLHKRAEEEAKAAEQELVDIQNAVREMMLENNLTTLPNPVEMATHDMSAFPDATSVAGTDDKLVDPDGDAYDANDKDGYLLYGHDLYGGDGTDNITVNYVNQRYTRGTYIVDALGTVTQVTTGYE